MPVGYPKDPVAHAAILAANRAEKEKITKHGHRAYKPSGTPRKKATVAAANSDEVPRVKRAYKSRKTATPKEVYAILADEGNTVVTAPGTMIKVLEEKIETLEVQLRNAEMRADKAELHLDAVLDLIALRR